MYYPAPGQPTQFPPRSLGKMRVMRERARRQEPLFHPGDAPLEEDEGLRPGASENGHGVYAAAVLKMCGGTTDVIDSRSPPTGRTRTDRERERSSKKYLKIFAAAQKRAERRRKKDAA